MAAQKILGASVAPNVINLHLSSYREKMLEHVFVGELMRLLWLRGVAGLEVLRPVVDDGGYDVALAVGSSIRYVQLKSSYRGSAVRGVKVNARLASKPGACVVWVQFDPDTIDIGPFLWFGDTPGQPLPDLGCFKVAKHTKGNAQGAKLERPNIRVVPRSAFTIVGTVDKLLSLLFGES
jgi:hypothetical protein